MTQTTFTDNVLVDGSQDIEQLRVQGHTTQDEPLQTWENSAGDVLAQVTGDGRLIVGDDVTPDSLIEAHRLDTSTSKPKRGIHSLGQVSGTLTTLVQWIVGELELKGSTAISALHTALRIRASNLNTGTPAGGAELRGGDIEVINDASAGTAALPKATGLQVAVTNASGKTITDAIGLKVKMDNAGTMTNPFSIYTEGAGPIHLDDYLEVKKPGSVPGTPAADFMRIYPRSNGRLYAKNSGGTEFELSGVDDPGLNQCRLSISSSDPSPAPGSTGTSVYIHPFNGEQISLYDTVTGKFIPRAITSAIAFDMTAAGALGGNQVPFMPHDIFLAWDAANNTFLKKVKHWADAPILKPVTNITNASPPVLTVGSSHGFAVNDLVVLQDVTGGAASLTNRLFRIVAIASTTVSLGDLGGTNIAAPGGTSMEGTLYKVTPETARGTGLTSLNGVKTYYDSIAGNYYKYIGTVAYGETKETIDDTVIYPFVYNAYNRIAREIGTTQGDSPTDTHWPISTTDETLTHARAAGNRYQERQWLLVGLSNEDLIDAEFSAIVYAPNANGGENTAFIFHITLDTIADFQSQNSACSAKAGTVYHVAPASGGERYVRDLAVRWEKPVAAGLHFLQPMEAAYTSSTNDWLVYTNFISGNYYRYKGGFQGKYTR